MKSKKKVLFFGPIGNDGGREVEVNLIANALKENYDLSILCLRKISEDSFALKNIDNFKWTVINREIYLKNPVIKVLGWFSKFYNRGNNSPFHYIRNGISKRIFNFDRLTDDVIEEQIKKVDIVIACVQLTSIYLDKVIALCNKLKKPIIIRTTGTINLNDVNLESIKGASRFLFHSNQNANILLNKIKVPYSIIDQCTLQEKTLLDLPIDVSKPLRYGYLGRLSEEKGISELAKYFQNCEHKFLIAGEGPLKNEILEIISKNDKCSYFGFVSLGEISSFFKEIDVLIIPSHEESGPLVGLEALAAGKIIISTKVGAMTDRLVETKNQFWININDLNTLESEITKLTTSSTVDLRNIAIENRENYLRNYNFTIIKEQYLSVVKNAI